MQRPKLDLATALLILRQAAARLEAQQPGNPPIRTLSDLEEGQQEAVARVLNFVLEPGRYVDVDDVATLRRMAVTLHETLVDLRDQIVPGEWDARYVKRLDTAIKDHDPSKL